MKNISKNILCFALLFILGCTATAQTTQSKQLKTNRVETLYQLESASSATRPNWLSVTPKAVDGYYFVGMSSKRTENRDARNESFNDALIGFARFCGLNVQYLAEHRDRSVGGNGGLIDTWTEGNTVAKMQAEMHLGNVTTKDRYTEKYSTFYGGSFMGHTYVDSSLVFVPTEEMELCKEHTQTANTFIKKKATEVNTLTAKNESLQSENKLLKKQNTNLTNVALSQAQNSSEFFKQVLNKPVIKKTEKPISVINNKPNNQYVSNSHPDYDSELIKIHRDEVPELFSNSAFYGEVFLSNNQKNPTFKIYFERNGTLEIELNEDTFDQGWWDASDPNATYCVSYKKLKGGETTCWLLYKVKGTDHYNYYYLDGKLRGSSIHERI